MNSMWALYVYTSVCVGTEIIDWKSFRKHCQTTHSLPSFHTFYWIGTQTTHYSFDLHGIFSSFLYLCIFFRFAHISLRGKFSHTCANFPMQAFACFMNVLTVSYSVAMVVEKCITSFSLCVYKKADDSDWYRYGDALNVFFEFGYCERSLSSSCIIPDNIVDGSENIFIWRCFSIFNINTMQTRSPFEQHFHISNKPIETDSDEVIMGKQTHLIHSASIQKYSMESKQFYQQYL